MKRKWIITLAVVVVLMAAGGLYANYKYSQRGIVTVQSGFAMRQDLASVVTASGEIKPRNYINIGTNAIVPSRITDILVVEGQQVRKGQILAKLESVQPEADVAAQRASLASSEADSSAAEAALNAADETILTQQATIQRTKADLEKAQINHDRTKRLVEDKLVAQQDYDQRRTELEAAKAGLREAESRLAQLKAARAQTAAALSAAQKRIALNNAQLRRANDVLERTMAVAPINGMVTNLPVRVGETVVPGIQNSASSLIMTIADMSVITAEVKVDETDIVNVSLGQVADVTIDAMPNKTFKGKVIEVGNTAILRSSGLAASQSAISSQEAKDFKVVIALDDPPSEIRPGLSCQAKITTAVRKNVITIPIQALTVRTKGDLEPAPKQGAAKAPEPTRPDPAKEKARKEEIQGVFLVKDGKATFQKVDTGITGATDIEVTGGVTDGQEIITGSYKAIRTLRNETKVKIDNKPSAPAQS